MVDCQTHPVSSKVATLLTKVFNKQTWAKLLAGAEDTKVVLAAPLLSP